MKIVLSVIAVTLVVIVGGLVWLVHAFGPNYGIWLFPPSPSTYGNKVLEILDSGIYAKGDEWAKTRAEAKTQIDQASSLEEVDEILVDAVKVAGGKHSFILKNEEFAQVSEDNTPPSSSLDGCILTVKMPAFIGTADQGQSYANTVATALDRDDLCGVIVDLRENGGGDMGPMLAGLTPLLPDGVSTSFVNTQGGESPVTIQGGSVTGGGTPTKVEVKRELNVPIAILTSDKTGSSGEQTLLAFRGMENARVFGQPTAGFASVNQGFPLPTNSVLYLTVGTTKARTGEAFGETPIPPDQETSLEEAPQVAAQWIKDQQ